MSEERRVDREGIHIEPDLADQLAIEEELDANVVGRYRFPSPRRRRLAAWVYLGGAVVAGLTIDGGWVVAGGLGLLAMWHLLSSWPLRVDEAEAMNTAAAVVEFPIGHVSASVRFQGWRSHPRWSVLLYSASEPPDRRALVLVDGVDGEVIGLPYVEAIEPV